MIPVKRSVLFSKDVQDSFKIIIESKKIKHVQAEDRQAKLKFISRIYELGKEFEDFKNDLLKDLSVNLEQLKADGLSDEEIKDKQIEAQIEINKQFNQFMEAEVGILPWKLDASKMPAIDEEFSGAQLVSLSKIGVYEV